MDRAGLAVDWSLSEKEDSSAKTRLAAYRPRIAAAYEAPTDDSKLRVAYIVVEALSGSAAEGLARELQNIDWKIESGRLMPSSATSVRRCHCWAACCFASDNAVTMSYWPSL